MTPTAAGDGRCVTTMPKTPPAAPTAEAPVEPVVKDVDEWRRIKSPPPWAHQAARVANHWCLGLLLTEADYDAALHAAQHGEIRLWPYRTFPAWT